MQTSGIFRTSKEQLIRRGLNGEEASGQALIELALTLPVLFLLLFGSAEMARLAYAAIEVSNAARAAVQYGSQSSAFAADTTGMQTAAQNEAPNITLGTTSVSTSCVCSDGSASTCLSTDCATSNLTKTITVQTQVAFDPLIHIPGLPQTFTLRGQAVQRVIGQ